MKTLRVGQAVTRQGRQTGKDTSGDNQKNDEDRKGKTQAETIRGMMKTGRESTDGLVSNRGYQHKPGRWRQKYSQTLDTLQTQEATTIKSKQEPKLRKTDPIWGCILVSQFPSSSSWCDEHSLESWMSAKSSQTHTAVHKKSCQSCSVWLNRLCFSTILR